MKTIFLKIKPTGVVIWCKGDIYHWHRDCDLPTVQGPDGSKAWYKNNMPVKHES